MQSEPSSLTKLKSQTLEFREAGEGNGTPHSSTLACKIPWTEEPGRRSLWGHKELDMTEQLHFHFSLSCIGGGNGNPLQCSCLEESQGRGSLVGSHLWGCTESDTTDVT